MSGWFLWVASVCIVMSGVSPAMAQENMPDHRARFCGFGGDRAILEGLQSYWPNLEYCRAYDGAQIENMRALGKLCNELKIHYSLQSCAPAFEPGYLEEHDCMAVDFLGRRPPEMGFGHPIADYCHPATRAALKHNLDVALTEVGGKSFSMVDFVWPYIGGRWGYSKADIEAYRNALNEADGGLTVVDAKEERVLTFWDYFYEFTSIRWQPEDLGFNSWDDYEPLRPNEMGENPSLEQRRGYVLFLALYHYCWLHYAQEGGAYARELGGELQGILNPENLYNGTDILTMGRLKATGRAWLEEWGSPWTVIANYHNLPYFTGAYRASGKRLGLMGETGAAGGHPDSGFGPARPHYWCPQANYGVTWALSAAGGYDDREEDYIWTGWEQTTDPASEQYDCWRGYVKAMDGFWQYAVDEPMRAQTPVVSIVNRSILHETDNSDNGTSQKFGLHQALLDLNIDYLQMGFPLDEKMLEEARIILFSPWDYPASVADRLRKWLDDKPGRVLVTHSFVPTRVYRADSWAVNPEPDNLKAAEAFGLTGLEKTEIKSGKLHVNKASWQQNFGLAEGTEVSLARQLIHCNGEALVKLDDANLVTDVYTPAGGRIVYLNFTTPEICKKNDITSDLLRSVMNALMTEEKIVPLATGSSQWAVARYEMDRGQTFFLLNREAAQQPRFTYETASMEPAQHIWLNLKPDRGYYIYDMIEETLGYRKTDAQGRLEVFLSGFNMRLLRILPDDETACLLFTQAWRTDGAARCELPAKLNLIRPGKAIITGLEPGTQILMDGKIHEGERRLTGKAIEVALEAGEHEIKVMD